MSLLDLSALLIVMPGGLAFLNNRFLKLPSSTGVTIWISQDILRGLDAASIGIASAAYDIVGFPPVRLDTETASSALPRPDRR